MNNVVVFKDAHDFTDRVRFANRGEELIPESFTGGRASHNARDVDESYRRGDDLLRVKHLRQDRESTIGNRDDADIGFNGGEGIVRREYVVLRQRVKER